ncbi:T9SS type A sorting domain-containing protein [uncultured Pontibacter sp.]|uniref:T9SS type A sorting domain-containing protein n=1 Tax=uncultured Pontibacter sp. TaxID=453356 RepID=UPI00262DDBA5|nr:T9SS type A sorting domain-containing protein [uncultured Pontibacter sp.]
MATPAFSSTPYDIGSPTSYSISAVHGAINYTWEASNNILINGSLSPLSTTSTSVAISQRPGYSGAGWVKVTAAGSQCGGSSVTKDVWVGIPEITGFSYSGGGSYPTCPHEEFIFEPVFNGYKDQPLRYRWSASNVSSHGDLTASSLIVTAAGYGGGTRMTIGLEVETTLGWTQKQQVQFEIRDCDSGAEPWFYPNPVAENELTIKVPANPDSNSTYTLLDKQGTTCAHGQLEGKEVKINTSNLREGLHLLIIEHNGKTHTRRVMIKK